MIFPLLWKLQRPGWLIPVFFLYLPGAWGQSVGADCAVTALGGTYLTRQGTSMAMYNQAGLGDVTDRTLSIQHARPFLIGDLGISCLSIQWGTSHGALGATLTHTGIRGFSETSAWLAYGINISSRWTAGLGLHFWNHSISERWFHHPGFSFAMGIRWSIHERVSWGIHIAHPVGWASGPPGKFAVPMSISTGVCLLPGHGTVLYLEVASVTGQALLWKMGLEWELRENIRLQFGWQPSPVILSGGFNFQHHGWNLQTAFAFGLETGVSPATGITYAW
ncbi:MAG: hypothetical protein ACWGNV_01020 [Bacteroidales bacterium]